MGPEVIVVLLMAAAVLAWLVMFVVALVEIVKHRQISGGGKVVWVLIAAGGVVGISVSGAGVGVVNTISTRTTAEIGDVTLRTASEVAVWAKGNAAITSDVISADLDRGRRGGRCGLGRGLGRGKPHRQPDAARWPARRRLRAGL